MPREFAEYAIEPKLGAVVEHDLSSHGFYVGNDRVLAICWGEGNLWLRSYKRRAVDEVSERILPHKEHLDEFLETGDVAGHLEKPMGAQWSRR